MSIRTAVRIALPMFVAGFAVGSWLAAEPVATQAAELEVGPVEVVSYTSRACCAQRCGRCNVCQPRYCVPAPSVTDEGVPTDQAAPTDQAPSPDTSAVAPQSMMAGGLGAAPAPGAVTPNMIGDSLFGGLPGDSAYFYNQGYGYRHGILPLAGGDRRFKMAENTSPRPQNRVFFNYNHFQNALIDINGRDHHLDRFTFGMEKTFFCDLASVEVRVPFSSALDSTQIASGTSNAGTEFGNIGLALKGILWQDCRTLISAGLGMTFPTGDDAVLVPAGGFEELRIDNDVIHLQPFIGILQAPTDRLFVQAYFQLDFSTAENGASYTSIGQFQTPQRQTQALYDQHLAYIDVSMGYWLHRNRCSRLVTGIAPMVELHYTSTLNDATTPTIAPGLLNNALNQLDSVNLTGGLLFELGPRSTLTVAGVAPMRRGDGRIFDSEVIVQFNRRF